MSQWYSIWLRRQRSWFGPRPLNFLWSKLGTCDRCESEKIIGLRCKVLFFVKIILSKFAIFFSNFWIFSKTLIFCGMKTFQELTSFYTHSTAILPPLDQKTQILYVFDKPNYSSCILQQICDNLVRLFKKIKFWIVQFCEIVQLAVKR